MEKLMHFLARSRNVLCTGLASGFVNRTLTSKPCSGIASSRSIGAMLQGDVLDDRQPQATSRGACAGER